MAAETSKSKVEEPGSIAVSTSDSFLTQIREIEDRVVQRAYDIFMNNGSQDGHALEDWVAAERELVWKPAIQIKETAGRFEVQAAVAGVDPKKLRIEACDHDLLIKGEPRKDREGKNGHKNGFHVDEFRSVSSLFRPISLPKKINPGRVKAKLKDGLLTITAPIAETAKNRRSTTDASAKAG